MPDYFFHNFPETIQNKNILDFIEKLEQISKAECRQIYLLTHPLLQKSDFLKYEYGCFMISSNMKIVFINFNDEMETDFKEYVEVMLDELQYVVKKHNFIPMLGRVKNWTNFYSTLSYSKEIEKKDIKTIIDYHSFDLQKPDNRSLARKCKALSGLAIGSVNDSDDVGLEVPDCLIDEIKHQIKLLDATQTDFIYPVLFTKT